ncbi:putative calcium-binding protein CML16 [Camellia lanceoleosa]|uniref:Calcium-binding protein CML16 n=1 Tax=Camellia lanceoleosa TaxID=1840588 RepID=A0ACC0FC79_9ERIC|nr:putative calcium-binding protein CML16 [Camellia lanceoleosa]
MSVVFEVNQPDQLRDIFSRFDMDLMAASPPRALASSAPRHQALRRPNPRPLSQHGRQWHGTVEFDELVNAITPHMTEDLLINQGQLLEVFKSFDRDGNGYITPAELAGSMAKWVSH